MNATNDNVVVPCERDTRTLTEAKLELPLQLEIALQIVRRVLVRHEATTEVIKRRVQFVIPVERIAQRLHDYRFSDGFGDEPWDEDEPADGDADAVGPQASPERPKPQ